MNQYLNDLEGNLACLVKTGALFSIKSEFEAEGTRLDELTIFLQLSQKYKVPLTIKVGGPYAKRDFVECFKFGVQNILVPMVESTSSLGSCLDSFGTLVPIFEDFSVAPRLFINIETYESIRNLDYLLNVINNSTVPVNRIVLGRIDLVNSMGLNDVNSEHILSIARGVYNKCRLNNIDFTIGGNLSSESYFFISNLSLTEFVSFESRKCTFRCDYPLNHQEFSKLINKAIEFEISWLRYRQSLYDVISVDDESRIRTLQSRLYY